MPISRYKNQRRGHEEDAIEDAPTQRSIKEEVDEPEDDVQPSSSRRKIKSEKKRRNTHPEAEDEDNDEGVDEDPLTTLGDQPLDKAQGARVAGLATDWEQVLKMGIAQFYGPMKNLAADSAEFAGDDGEEVSQELERMFKNLIDSEKEILVHQGTLSEMHQKIARGDNIVDPVSIYESNAKRKLKEYKENTSRQKYARHDEYSGFRQAIFEVQNPGAAMPPVTEFIPKEPGDDSDEDEDVEIGGVTQDYRCPLSLTIMVNPLTSMICGHSFSSDAIREYLSSSGVWRKRCPTTGCNKEISLTDLRPNKELARKAKEAQRRERMREEDESSEEDSEVVE